MLEAQKRRRRAILATITIAAALFLVIRSHGLTPRIFADEYTYSYYAKFFGNSNSGIPSFLYFAVYQIVNYCENGLLACARYLNIAFFVGGGLLVYLTGRSRVSDGRNIILTTIALFSPYSLYTHFFMPESMFYFGFWLFIYLFLNVKEYDSLKSYLWPSITLGVVSLVKPHALLFMPACLAYIALQSERKSQALKILLFFGSSTLITKLLIGYLLVGENGITLFGSNYTSHASSVASSVTTVLSIWPSITANLIGNIAALIFIYGVTIPYVVASLFDKFSSKSGSQKIAVLLLLNLVIVVVLFTSTVPLFEDNQDYRIYFRYYGFIFPLLFISVVETFQNERTSSYSISTLVSLSTSLVLVAAVMYLYISRYKSLYPYNIFISDIPEMFYLLTNKHLIWAYGLLSATSLLLFLTNSAYKQKIYLAFLMVSTFTFVVMSYISTRADAHLDTADRAGLYIKDNLSSEAQDSLIVIGTTEFQLQQVLFYSDSQKSAHKVVDSQEGFNQSELNSAHRYILQLGDLNFHGDRHPIYLGDGFSLHVVSPK